MYLANCSFPFFAVISRGSSPQHSSLSPSVRQSTVFSQEHTAAATSPAACTSDSFRHASIPRFSSTSSPGNRKMQSGSLQRNPLHSSAAEYITGPADIQPHEARAGDDGQSTDPQQLPLHTELTLGSKPEAKSLAPEKKIAMEVHSTDQLSEATFLEPNSTIARTSLASSTESLASSEHSEHSRLSSASLASRQSLPVTPSKSAFTASAEQQAAYQSTSLPQLGEKSSSVADPQR